MTDMNCYMNAKANFVAQQLTEEEKLIQQSREACLVMDLEELYEDIVRLVSQLFEHDNWVHLEATKARDVKLLQKWMGDFKDFIVRMLNNIQRFERICRRAKVEAYKEVKVSYETLGSCERRLQAALASDESYLEREDVGAAIRESEDDFRAGRSESDPVG